MRRRVVTGVMAAVLVAASAAVRAQDVTPKGTDDRGAGLVDRFKVDRGGGFRISRFFSAVFGGIKQGSGPAIGPALSYEFDNGAYAQLKAVYSLRSFKLLQGRFDSQPLLDERLTLSTRVRWQDAPELSLYQMGIDSPDLRAEYSERKTEWSGVARITLRRTTTLLGGAGIERYAIDGGWLDAGEDEAAAGVPQTPALGTKPWFVHSFVQIVQDTRLSPDYSRTGRLLDAAWHDYHDARDGELSFQRAIVAAYQLFPAWRARGALGLGGQAWLSAAGEERQVPFFLMPTLGGGNYLRAYSSYRFREGNALLLQAEYRHAVHPMVDVAGLYEAGSVSRTVGGLSLRDMAQSVAAGVRVHTKTSGVFRADLARGRDGFKVAFGVGLGGGS